MLVPLQLSLIDETDMSGVPHVGACCDWLTLVHTYPEGAAIRESGRVLKLDSDGVLEWQTQCWDAIRCESSDTSVRARCDGRTLRVTGNLGRFGRPDNIRGYSVAHCVDRARVLLDSLDFELQGFGAAGSVSEHGRLGTVISRVDLAGNYEVSDYPGLCHAMSVRRVGRLLPIMGRYGPTWGYGAKRGGWVRAKLYDKAAEQAGRKTVASGATLARFEVQLGAEFLRRSGLDTVEAWGTGDDMANVVYGRFANQVFRDSASVEDWSELPRSLRQYAVLWRDGVDIRSLVSKATYYRVASKLAVLGFDITTPCNVQALTRVVREVRVQQVSALAA